MNEALSDFLPGPGSIHLEINSDCNLQCAICANHHRYNVAAAGRMLSRLEIGSILSQIPGPPPRIILTGGEPLLHPDIIGILDDLSGARVCHTIYTNASIPISDELMRALTEDKFLVHFTVSLHSSSPVEHEAMTGLAGSFKTTSDNIVRLQKTGVPVVVNSVLTQETPSDILDTVRYILGLGGSFAGLTKYFRPGPIEPDAHVTPPSVERMRTAAELIKRAGLEESAELDCCHGCETGLDFHEPCYAARTFCAIKPDGFVTPCIFSAEELGNVLDESFESIWNSEVAMRWRENICASCSSCPRLDDCLAGCRATEVNPKAASLVHTWPGTPDEAPEAIPLYKHLKVIPDFQWQRGHSGAFLFHGRHTRYLPGNDIPLVESMAQNATLEMISDQFGDDAVNTVYDLHQDHMLTLQ